MTEETELSLQEILLVLFSLACHGSNLLDLPLF